MQHGVDVDDMLDTGTLERKSKGRGHHLSLGKSLMKRMVLMKMKQTRTSRRDEKQVTDFRACSFSCSDCDTALRCSSLPPASSSVGESTCNSTEQEP
ncbi:hypothetical protein JZ751_015520 [Albula glossodonta]|uniref:Uncharacterized protein n=1 Tax=Albula glossodonta TaxID=121402 RepID=A0A8T2MV43_9TELE|nr:hypothetical protein JZ751_015520 [Albula glossodonta]